MTRTCLIVALAALTLTGCSSRMLRPVDEAGVVYDDALLPLGDPGESRGGIRIDLIEETHRPPGEADLIDRIRIKIEIANRSDRSVRLDLAGVRLEDAESIPLPILGRSIPSYAEGERLSVEPGDIAAAELHYGYPTGTVRTSDVQELFLTFNYRYGEEIVDAFVPYQRVRVPAPFGANFVVLFGFGVRDAYCPTWYCCPGHDPHDPHHHPRPNGDEPSDWRATRRVRFQRDYRQHVRAGTHRTSRRSYDREDRNGSLFKSSARSSRSSRATRSSRSAGRSPSRSSSRSASRSSRSMSSGRKR